MQQGKPIEDRGQKTEDNNESIRLSENQSESIRLSEKQRTDFSEFFWLTQYKCYCKMYTMVIGKYF